MIAVNEGLLNVGIGVLIAYVGLSILAGIIGLVLFVWIFRKMFKFKEF